MRVLLLSKANIVGIYQRKLEAMARQGVDLLALVPPSWKDERGETRLERVYTDGYRLQETPIWLNGSFHLHYYPELGRWIREFQPHIVHIDEEPYNLAAWQALALAQRAGAKTLFFSWQNIARCYPPPFSWGERWVLQTVDYALMGTASAAAVWRAKGYRGRLAVVPQFGVDGELFKFSVSSFQFPVSSRQSPEDRQDSAVSGENSELSTQNSALSSQSSVSSRQSPVASQESEATGYELQATGNQPFTIGYVGRLVAEKGVHLLLEAAARLSGEWRLRVVGSGPERERLRALAERLGIGGRVEWVDWAASTEMPAQYRRLDALALPSLTRPNWKEQFGRVLIEAMASGVAVIGSDSGAIPDVIGDAGLVFPEGDVEALADGLRRLQTDEGLRARLREAGRARVLAQFTHEQVAAATVAVYQELQGD